ncbi:polymer-forming cytoskeletal protein [Desulfopila sp. IMCC35006]|uniref:bactofilin family protein n=1 Tax=Desulfopila sp. IMCC35006 TaxID=2569542 RepID=UPI001F0CEAEE|nr:polymer-forming cytoskeletal protein [Desulfopila sp. IMCC35006]
MGIFGKTMNVAQEMKKVDGEAIASIIDKNMTLTGEVLFQGKARIDGTITGDINGEHLILSETGKVIGDITVSSFNCYGSLEGNIKTNMLIARKSCSIQGKLEAGNLTVEPGACIQGEILAATPTQVFNPGEADDAIAATLITSSE